MTEPGDVDGLCRYLDWDSNFFQRRIARLLPTRLEPGRLDQALDWCRSQNIDCLYFLASGDHPASLRLACLHGFILMDTRLTLECRLPNAGLAAEPYQGDILVRSWVPGDVPVLSDIAAQSFIQTRFHNDPAFTREQATALYRTWIEVSCQGYADCVLVAVDLTAPAGFISLKFDPTQQHGTIALLGVAAAHRQRGVGRQLVHAGLEWLVAQGARRVSVVTAGANMAALHLYQRSGFYITSMEYWFHKWFLDSAEAG